MSANTLLSPPPELSLPRIGSDVPNPTKPSIDTPPLLSSYTLDYMHPTHDELLFALDAVKQIEKSNLVRRCHNAMEEAGDQPTVSHCHRVAIASTILGVRLGFSEEELLVAGTAATCHDVGRTVPEILVLVQSNVRYQGDERQRVMEVIRRHAVLGAEIVRACGAEEEGCEVIAELVGGHHSLSVDDPYGIESRLFPRGEGVIGFCDQLDALASDRTYKAAMPEAETCDILRVQFGGDLRLLDLCFDHAA